jgi:hypothetical protein
MRALRVTLIVIGIFQLLLGAAFLAAPAAAPHLLGMRPAAPAWANWLFAMMAGRFLGYAYGMFTAARAPREHRAWIDTMIVIQAIDWIATVAYLASGHLTFGQVTTAAFMPVIFIAVLAWYRLASGGRAAAAEIAAGRG